MTGRRPEPPGAPALRAARFGALWFATSRRDRAVQPLRAAVVPELGCPRWSSAPSPRCRAGRASSRPMPGAGAGDHSGRRVRTDALAALGSLLAACRLLGVRGAVPVALVTALLFVANGGVVPLYEATLAHLLNTAAAWTPPLWPRAGVGLGRLHRLGDGLRRLLEWVGIGALSGFRGGHERALLLAACACRPRATTPGREPAPPVLPLLRRPEVAWFFASIFFTVLAHTSLYAFFSLYLVSLGYGKRRWARCGRCRWRWRSPSSGAGRWFDRCWRRMLAAGGGGGHRAALRGHRRLRRLGRGAGAGAGAARHHLRRPPPACIAEVNRLFPAGCAAAARPCTRCWATVCRACWAAWAAAG
jgi:hypothetical protein